MQKPNFEKIPQLELIDRINGVARTNKWVATHVIGVHPVLFSCWLRGSRPYGAIGRKKIETLESWLSEEEARLCAILEK